jgi:hypothetical protein
MGKDFVSVVAYFKILSQPRYTEEDHERPQSGKPVKQ